MIHVKILVVDDHRLVRAGICSLLEKIPTFETIAEADNGREAMKLVDKYNPDVILLDIAMREMNGLEVLNKLSTDYPEISVIILSMHKDEEYVIRALQLGADGYLLKDSAKNELETAIKTVIQGEKYLTPILKESLGDEYKNLVVGKDNLYRTHLERLTPRKREILQLIAEGNTTKEIAYKLDLSIKTVDAHKKQLMETLNIYDIAGLVRYALKAKMISLDS